MRNSTERMDWMTIGETRDDFDFDAYLDDPTPGYRYAVNNHAEHEDRETAFGAGESFAERLIAQVGLRPVTDRQRLLATFLIGNLDEAGYLRRDLYAITSDLAFGQGLEVDESELEAVLEVVHQLDPAGQGDHLQPLARPEAELLTRPPGNSGRVRQARKPVCRTLPL